MKIEVSNGEAVDKLTILQIKLEKITDEDKLKNIQKEFDLINSEIKNIISTDDPLYQQLLEINQKLWLIEDKLRKMERDQNFNQAFIETARSVYFINDLRARVKMQINQKTGSQLFEEKSYEDY